MNSLNCEFTPANELVDAIQLSDAVLIGSPTLGGHAPTPIVSALGTLLAEGDRSKPVGVFGSFGWSGEAVDLLENKLRDGGFSFGFEPIRVKFSPDAARVKQLEETGTRFGRELLKIQKRAQRRSAGGLSESRSDPAVVALGRVLGSLCVLTTRKGDLSGAMVANWVSQASFSSGNHGGRRQGPCRRSPAAQRRSLRLERAGRRSRDRPDETVPTTVRTRCRSLRRP